MPPMIALLLCSVLAAPPWVALPRDVGREGEREPPHQLRATNPSRFARGGPKSTRYPWGGEAPSDAMGCLSGAQGRSETCRVGQFPRGASAYGVYDLSGNVAEITSTIDLLAQRNHWRRPQPGARLPLRQTTTVKSFVNVGQRIVR